MTLPRSLPRLSFKRDDRVVDEATKQKRHLRKGILGAIVVVLGLAAAGTLYVVPFGKHTYTAELSEAQSVKAGDDVRLAGISVGEVKSLELKPDKVVMRFTVKTDVFLGDQTSLDIRMLTIVGGHYVALFPAGSKPLGSAPIPADRVRLPYSLVETFQDAATPLAKIDGSTLNKNLAALGNSIDGAPDSLRTTLTTVADYVDALDRQRSQVSNAIAVADEYVRMYDGAKTDLGRLMDNANLLVTVLEDKHSEMAEAIRLLSDVLGRLGGAEPTWSELKPKLTDAITELEQLGQKFTPTLTAAQELQKKLSDLVIPDGGVQIDQSQQTVPLPQPPVALPQVCIPVLGKEC
ncbi:mammalian cell entry protein [Nocardia seriolae]|nr:MlaD family protein [Nocardia seriolae]OJF78691.1 mammalian cell entry protein [Nocardia seriolae]PSK31389.1 MCE family protein [Nocardia seriolae]QOW36970.1 MCE family protein [Nocardia seriolae]QUN18665.1 MCE family protein [Nocardia seriolae]